MSFLILEWKSGRRRRRREEERWMDGWMKRGSSLLRHLLDCDKHANSLHTWKKRVHFSSLLISTHLLPPQSTRITITVWEGNGNNTHMYVHQNQIYFPYPKGNAVCVFSHVSCDPAALTLDSRCLLSLRHKHLPPHNCINIPPLGQMGPGNPPTPLPPLPQSNDFSDLRP